MEQTDKTQAEKIERLATEVMGWELINNNWWGKDAKGLPIFKARATWKGRYEESDVLWNPLTDWNHWRQVEERVMEDEALFMRWTTTLGGRQYFKWLNVFKADLPTRVDALLSALDSLKS